MREQQVIIAWCTLFLQTIAKDVPASAMSEDTAEREKNHWWKAKKWSYYSLNRLYVRYVNRNHLRK